MRVAYIKPTSEGKRFIVGVDGGEEKQKYNISGSLYLSLGLSRGDELDEDTAELLIEDNARYSCMRSALCFLSYADNNKRTLYMKLLRRGYDRTIINETVEECVRLGYINECDQIERAILKEAEKLYGRAYIFKKLTSKGYSASMVNRAFEELIQRGDVDFSANLQTLLYKKDCKSDEERKKLMHKYGYLTRDFYDD